MIQFIYSLVPTRNIQARVGQIVPWESSVKTTVSSYGVQAATRVHLGAMTVNGIEAASKEGGVFGESGPGNSASPAPGDRVLAIAPAVAPAREM